MQKGIDELNEILLDICAELEARLDYPQEGLEYESDKALIDRLHHVAGSAADSASTWQAGKIRIHGAKVALIGPVNAGKSSLFNHLAGRKRAIVSSTPGTTRDVVEHTTLIDGIEVTLMDMAGIRSDTTDSIESEGIALGLEMLREADLCLIISPVHQFDHKGFAELQSLVDKIPFISVGTHAILSMPTKYQMSLT